MCFHCLRNVDVCICLSQMWAVGKLSWEISPDWTQHCLEPRGSFQVPSQLAVRFIHVLSTVIKSESCSAEWSVCRHKNSPRERKRRLKEQDDAHFYSDVSWLVAVVHVVRQRFSVNRWCSWKASLLVIVNVKHHFISSQIYLLSVSQSIWTQDTVCTLLTNCRNVDPQKITLKKISLEKIIFTNINSLLSH